MKSIREQAAAAAHWWRALQPNTAIGERNRVGDRAALARLRRADLAAAMSDPATFDLFRMLGCSRREYWYLPAVALCAAVLAGVRNELPPPRDREHPARTLGPPPMGAVEEAVMKRMRFRRLIEADTPEERLILLRRAVQLADRRLNLRELAAACLDWSERRRQRWIFEYYNAGFAAPAAEPNVEISQA
jgi:CRISPR system Cascade subunit CasB